jgi:hypothetical protein
MERMDIREVNARQYAALESGWKTILADADLVPTEEKESSSPTNGPGGDEKEDGNVVSKLKERKYRIGLLHLSYQFREGCCEN